MYIVGKGVSTTIARAQSRLHFTSAIAHRTKRLTVIFFHHSYHQLPAWLWIYGYKYGICLADEWNSYQQKTNHVSSASVVCIT